MLGYFALGLLALLCLPLFGAALAAAGVIIAISWKIVIYGCAMCLMIIGIGWLVSKLF